MYNINQGNGFYSRLIKDKKISLISDGALFFPNAMFAQEATEEEIKNQLIQKGINVNEPTPVQVNALVVEEGKNLTLLDVGTDKNFNSSVGDFLNNFKNAGYNENDVNRIVLTHLHFDHFGYLFDSNGKPIFPNAEIIIHDKEYQFWKESSPDLSSVRVDEETKKFFITSAKQIIDFLGKNVTLKESGKEVAPGIVIEAAPGHTPGHVIVEMDDFVYLADTFVHQWLHLPHPEWSSMVDVDPQMGKETRKRILDKVSQENILVSGSHINFPSFGKISKNDKGYDFLHEPFHWNE